MASGDFQKLNHLPDGWQIDYQPSATSSNDLAFACLKNNPGQAEGRCFRVGEQTKGRGRRGKQWVSRPGDGLYLSIVLCPKAPRYTWPSLSFLASLGVYKALLRHMDEQHHGACSLKWPNDILCHDRKLAGILLESSDEGLVIGCGVNLNNAPELGGIAHPPIAIDELVSEGVSDAEALAATLVARIAELYTLWQSSGHQIILDEWRRHCDMKGNPVRIQTVTEVIEGLCEGVGADGQLYVRRNDGEVVQITAGDVEIMRGRNASGD